MFFKNTSEYQYKWSKIGRKFRYFLNMFGLALEKDHAYCDYMWLNALNHCTTYLTDKSTPKQVKENLALLLVQIDETGEENINDWLNDFNELGKENSKEKFTKDYIEFLGEVCPMIRKYQKILHKDEK